MKLEIETTEEEAKAFMLVYAVGLALVSGRAEAAVIRAVAIQQNELLARKAGAMMRKMCKAIDPDAALVADAAEAIRLDRN